MAIIECAECGEKVSDKAEQCPHCGSPRKIYSAERIQPTFRTIVMHFPRW